jgi:Family of unknown function (DUF6010)
MMNNHAVPDFAFSNFLLAALLAPIFITIMSLLKAPLRQKINAGLIAVAGGAYINAGLMPFDQFFNILLVFIAYKGLQNYKFIALGWVLHTCWDIVHHFYGNPIDPSVPYSTNVCAFFDPMIAAWFYIGAPPVFDVVKKKFKTVNKSFLLCFALIFATLNTPLKAQVNYSFGADTIVLAQKNYEKNGVKTAFNPVFPKGVLRKEIAKNGGKEANIEYKQYLKTVGNFWILNGLQLVIAILSLFVIDSNSLFLVSSLLATLILIVGSLILLRKLKRRLAYAIRNYNKNVLSNKPS